MLMDPIITFRLYIKMLTKIIPIIVILCLLTCKNDIHQGSDERIIKIFNDNWEFVKDLDIKIDASLFSKGNKQKWQKVDLPHTAQIEPLVIKGNQWQGICYYRKFFSLTKDNEGKLVALKFEGAMQVADVYLNGKRIKTNYGGYLPFYVDITNEVIYDNENCLLVKLDNRDNPQVPPGKPVANLDFNIYGGVYRNVWLLIENKLHITDPSEVNKVAGGGVFITFPEVTKDFAKINADIDVENSHHEKTNVQIEASLLDSDGKTIQNLQSLKQDISAKSSNVFHIGFELKSPKLWSPDSPNLYKLKIILLKDGKLVGSETHKFGIRSFSFSVKDGFILNGNPLKLRGTNRHQEYPYIGYALSDNANFRDAFKIKQAGFNFVRLSHYPQSESFLTACDELGILVMDAIPGWQFFGDCTFQEHAISDVRRMIRRDRNHPSIIIWEASLNESGMSKEFMKKAHDAVHEEFPGKNVYTSGWIDEEYDIYIPARQHSKPPYYWNKYDKNKPILIAEYGDWEYYAQNAGFNQKTYKNLSDEERNSRQLRGFGQKRLLQQAFNFQESHNDNLNGNAVGDANWLMFDYNRGYAPDIEASGIMDIFRLPKFAFYLYQSQININENLSGGFSKPMIFIANYYYDPSFLEIKLFSNCDEVELILNGKSIEKRKPDNDKNTTNLAHPPFTFKLKDFIPGELKAIGYAGGKQVVSTIQKTPGTAVALKLWIDESGKPPEKGCNDAVFVHAAVIDANGTIIPEAVSNIKFSVLGNAELIGTNPIETEAGIASILLKVGKKGGPLEISASSEGLKTSNLKLIVH
jgi:beta-galactosidase